MTDVDEVANVELDVAVLGVVVGSHAALRIQQTAVGVEKGRVEVLKVVVGLLVLDRGDAVERTAGMGTVAEVERAAAGGGTGSRIVGKLHQREVAAPLGLARRVGAVGA